MHDVGVQFGASVLVTDATVIVESPAALVAITCSQMVLTTAPAPINELAAWHSLDEGTRAGSLSEVILTFGSDELIAVPKNTLPAVWPITHIDGNSLDIQAEGQRK